MKKNIAMFVSGIALAVFFGITFNVFKEGNEISAAKKKERAAQVTVLGTRVNQLGQLVEVTQ